MNPVRVGFCGLGTVGAGAIDALRNSSERIAQRVGAPVVVTRAAVRDTSKQRGCDLTGIELTTDPLAVATADDIDVVVEVIGGVGIAKQVVEAALDAGKSVVTCNKELIAKHGPALFKQARDRGVDLAFEGSVGGGIPILGSLRSCLAGNRVQAVMGIINGTTNYMLSKMAATGLPFDQLLAEAQAAGYAEADPTDDVEGYDAAYKLAILAMLAYDTPVDPKDIYCEGITKVSPADIEVARSLGYVIKLLGIARDLGDHLELRVHPTLVRDTHPLAAVNDVFNAIFVEGSAVGQVMLYGRGAGDGPTGSAVVGDLVSVARHRVNGCGGESPVLGEARPIAPKDAMRSRFFVRMTVADRPGVLAKLATILGAHDVSLAQMQQTESGGGRASIVWITHETGEQAMQASLAEMQQPGGPVHSIDNVLRSLDHD